MRFKTLAAWPAALMLSMTAFALAGANDGDTDGAGQRSADVARGRYLVRITGCNDCHTPEYAARSGSVDEANWLTGSALGWEGPWGTTYPPNLRLLVSELTRGQWLTHVRQPTRPPMPWFALRDMSDEDLTAIYRFIRSLGPAGTPAPEYEPPRGTAKTAVVRRWRAE